MATCDTFLTPTFPFGPYQRFTYGSLVVALNWTDNVYLPGQGQNFLEKWGYDRYQDNELLPKTFYGDQGASHWEGPSFTTPYRFEWKLQNLPVADYYKLWAMYRLSLRDRQPILLDDARLALDEPTPRVRGKVGTVTGAPTVAGMEYFFPRFKIILDLGRERERWQQGYNLNMTAIEYDPDTPVVGDIS